jgi:hypothetical protein
MHPEWSDNQTFEEARRWIIAEIEAITFYEFLPALLGQVLPRYDGYKLNTNPSATSFFTTVRALTSMSSVNLKKTKNKTK